VEEYRTEEEQVEALRRWWSENGRSIVAAVIIALAGSFAWQTWQSSQQANLEQASEIYQAMLRAIGTGEASADSQAGVALAEQLKQDFDGSTYAQFAALHLAALAVNEGNLAEAESQLRWVLTKAAKGSDVEELAELRLARVLASSGDTDQALAILAKAVEGPYGASYAAARGDILLGLGRNDEARDSYMQALALASDNREGLNLPVLQQKLQSLTPMPVRTLEETTTNLPDTSAPATSDTVDLQEE
jgi:predicted negative regulator of RcsB-dependent stress response